MKLEVPIKKKNGIRIYKDVDPIVQAICNGKLHAKLSQNVVKPDHTCKKPGTQNDPHLMDCNKAPLTKFKGNL